MPKRVKKDENQLAHALVERIGNDDSGEPQPLTRAQLSAYMSALGKKGGEASGRLRKQNLSEQKRRDIASRAARKRWADVAKRKQAAKKR